jgi:Na+/H+ antiporter NhaC
MNKKSIFMVFVVFLLLLPKSSTSQLGRTVSTKTSSYYPLQITLVLVVLYLISLFLARKKVISFDSHKMIWNVALTISFIVVAITSIQYLLVLEYGLFWTFGMNINRLHIESGIVMLVISIFHIFWHVSYYKSIFRRRKSKKLPENSSE